MKFAKLFDVKDTQVLYLLSHYTDGRPAIQVLTTHEGKAIDIYMCSQDHGPEAFQVIQDSFESLTQKDAENQYERIVSSLNRSIA